jgi:hypothetical protein
MIECSTGYRSRTEVTEIIDTVLGPEDNTKTTDRAGLFKTDMYISTIHGGHRSGKTSSFKRCVFLKYTREPGLTTTLSITIESRPLPFYYLHLMQGGGAFGDLAASVTAFGCWDWDFTSVITGV